jgi:hypothetical protein
MDIKQQYSTQVAKLFNEQYKNWPLMTNNYNDLSKIKTKILEFSGFDMKVQFNPARIRSSAAKVDKASIENRACFLCSENRPKVQEAVEFEDVFLILVNPFPIFPQHFTITHKEHVPQLIKVNFMWMLKLAKALPDFTIFYNGPRCGASAPDHFHFQAGTKNYMPIDYQIDNLKLKYGRLQVDSNRKVWIINDLVRTFLLIESKDAEEIDSIFSNLYESLSKLKYTEDEPDMNIHASFCEDKWRILLFPRGKHRPHQFYAEGEENILFSPASVDLGGLLIMPLEKDFEKINIDLAQDMMKQISVDEKLFENIGFD